jgi:hypothetical protein
MDWRGGLPGKCRNDRERKEAWVVGVSVVCGGEMWRVAGAGFCGIPVFLKRVQRIGWVVAGSCAIWNVCVPVCVGSVRVDMAVSLLSGGGEMPSGSPGGVLV